MQCFWKKKIRYKILLDIKADTPSPFISFFLFWFVVEFKFNTLIDLPNYVFHLRPSIQQSDLQISPVFHINYFPIITVYNNYIFCNTFYILLLSIFIPFLHIYWNVKVPIKYHCMLLITISIILLVLLLLLVLY